MTEPSTSAPAETQKVFIPKDVLFALVNTITTQLNEPKRYLIRQIVLVVGVERAQALFQQTLAIEAAGGQMTRDGTRRKTPGGVFISLARAQAVDKAERMCLLDFGPPKPRSPKGRAQGAAEPEPPGDGAPAAPSPQAAKPTSTPSTTEQSVSPRLAPTWDEAKQLVKEAIQAIGEARTVKITLIGRPGKVVQQPSCVVVAMKGKAPPSLPKGLPTPPANSGVTWAVFIATKQWDKVKEFITQQADDQLLIEGYPLLDPKSGSGVVLATSCKSVLQEKAQREAKQSG